MTPIRLLIDDRGAAWPVEPQTIARRFGGFRNSCDCMAGAVALGFIFLGLSAAGVRIALRPQFVAQKSLARLASLIDGKRTDRIAVSFDAALSSWEFIFGVDAAMLRIDALVALAQHPQPRPLLFSTRLPIECCPTPAGGEVLSALQLWEHRQGQWDAEVYQRLLEWKLLPLTVISQQPPRSEQVQIQHWGTRITTYGREWIRAARGRDIEDTPNLEVARWQAAMVRQTIAEGAPRLWASDFVLRGIDGELSRITFKRLDLPWRLSDGAVRLSAIVADRRKVVLERLGPAN